MSATRLPAAGRRCAVLIENMLRADAAHFATHPAARCYVREPVRGEFSPARDPAPGSVVLVRQLAPGVRMRLVFSPPKAGGPAMGIVIGRDGSAEVVAL